MELSLATGSGVGEQSAGQWAPRARRGPHCGSAWGSWVRVTRPPARVLRDVSSRRLPARNPSPWARSALTQRVRHASAVRAGHCGPVRSRLAARSCACVCAACAARCVLRPHSAPLVSVRTVDRGLLSQPAHPRRICTALRLPGSCLCSPNVAANVAAGASAIALASPVLRLTLHYSSPRMAPFLRMAGCVAQAYLAAELAWYCFCESEKKRFEPLVQHATITATQRQVLWQRCLKWSENRRLWLQGWFNNIDTFERITRPDILDFLAWGFWGIRARELAPSDSKQLETMVSELETSVSTAAAHYTFPARGTA